MTATPSAPPAQTPAPAPPRSPWSGGRIALVVAGGILAALGANCLAGAALLSWADTLRDDAGYFTTSPKIITSDSNAVSVPSLEVSGYGPDALYEQEMLGELRVHAGSTDPDVALFIGLGPAEDVASYLNGVSHDELADIDTNPFDLSTTAHDGGAPATPPDEQTFWAESTEGTGMQTLDWDVEQGDWAIVIMNADGSPGVQIAFSAGASLPVLDTVTRWCLVGGSLLLLIGMVMIVVAILDRRPASSRVAVNG